MSAWTTSTRDWISSLVYERHLWPDEYLQHLMKVIGTIGKHGRAVIVGRGAQFVLPPVDNLRVRVIAPMRKRIRNAVAELGVSESEAQKIILRTDADRRSFSRKYFYADVSDPINYDLVINMDRMDLETAAKTIIAALNQLNA